MSFILKYSSNRRELSFLIDLLSNLDDDIESVDIIRLGRDELQFDVEPKSKARVLYSYMKDNIFEDFVVKNIDIEIYHYQDVFKASYFHSINLYDDYNDKSIVNMVIEIPKYNTLKMEINKELEYNPIVPDIKDGKVRHVRYKALGSKREGYPFHYGALPQTWENKLEKDPRVGLPGDNDPVDAFDINDVHRNVGDVVKVRLLGAIAMIDNGETDWKMVVSSNSVYEKLMDVPESILNTIVDFLRNYKTVEGKGQNSFAKKMMYNESEAVEIVSECHHSWFHLVNGGLVEDISLNSIEY